MNEEYVSRFYPDINNFSFKAYHTTFPHAMSDIFKDGYLDPQKGVETFNVTWFSISEDVYYGTHRFTFELNQDTFKEFDFMWFHDYYLGCKSKIYVMDKRLRVHSIGGTKIDDLYAETYDGTEESLKSFVDKTFALSYPFVIPKELLTKKLSQQYGFDYETWV